MDEEVNPVDAVEEAFRLLAETALGEAVILAGWVGVMEVVDENMNRMLLPFSKSDQPSWVTKSLHQEAVDGVRNQEVLEELLEARSVGGDDDGGEDTE